MYPPSVPFWKYLWHGIQAWWWWWWGEGVAIFLSPDERRVLLEDTMYRLKWRGVSGAAPYLLYSKAAFLTELMDAFLVLIRLLKLACPQYVYEYTGCMSVLSAKKQYVRKKLVLFNPMELHRNFKGTYLNSEVSVSQICAVVVNVALCSGRVCGKAPVFLWCTKISGLWMKKQEYQTEQSQ